MSTPLPGFRVEEPRTINEAIAACNGQPGNLFVAGGPEGGPCPLLRQKRSKPDPIGYCGGCGCGDREEGKLSRKVAMRGVKRPAGCLWPIGDC